MEVLVRHYPDCWVDCAKFCAQIPMPKPHHYPRNIDRLPERKKPWSLLGDLGKCSRGELAGRASRNCVAYHGRIADLTDLNKIYWYRADLGDRTWRQGSRWSKLPHWAIQTTNPCAREGSQAFSRAIRHGTKYESPYAIRFNQFGSDR
jgi:hypothetical protein